MEHNIEMIKNIITSSEISSTMAIYDKGDKELFNNGIIVEQKELDKIRQAYKKRNKLFINGIKINKKKYILLNTSKITYDIYFVHCKKYNEGYIFIVIENIIIIVNYYDEYIPYQHDTKIQQIVKEIEKLF